MFFSTLSPFLHIHIHRESREICHKYTKDFLLLPLSPILPSLTVIKKIGFPPLPPPKRAAFSSSRNPPLSLLKQVLWEKKKLHGTKLT